MSMYLRRISVLLFASLTFAASLFAQKKLTPSEAKEHFGETATVCGELLSIYIYPDPSVRIVHGVLGSSNGSCAKSIPSQSSCFWFRLSAKIGQIYEGAAGGRFFQVPPKSTSQIRR